MANLLHNKPPSHNSTNTTLCFEKKIASLLYEKYFFDDNYYNTCMINDIIYNEKSHVVAMFKNFLILDDDSEFLKRFYTKDESLSRLPKFFEYYGTYSKIFPNYTILAESRYIFKNIHKKQKMIDIQQENNSNKSKEKKNKKVKESKTDEVFSTDVYNSIVNDNDDIAMLFNIKRENNNNSGNYNSKGCGKNKDESNNEIMKIYSLINQISIKERQINKSNNKIIDTHRQTNTSEYNSLKKHILTPRMISSKQAKILNRLIFKGNNESISKFIRQELLIQSKRNTLNLSKSNEHSLAAIIKNDKIKIGNTSRTNSIYQNDKANKSITITPQIPMSISVRPLTHRESSCSKLKENDKSNNNIDNSKMNSPPETERIRVNIRPIMKEETEKTKQDIISQIRANNKFFFQSKLIASQFNQQLKLSIGNKDNLLSPQATNTQKIINNENNMRNKSSTNMTNLSNLNIIKCDQQKSNQNNYKEIKDNGNDHNHINNNSSIVIKDKRIYSIRPKNRSNQNQKVKLTHNIIAKNNDIKNDHKQLVINNNSLKKQLLPNNNSLHISSSIPISPIKKVVKGIEIKNFSKALRLLDNPLQKINTERLENHNTGNKIKIAE